MAERCRICGHGRRRVVAWGEARLCEDCIRWLDEMGLNEESEIGFVPAPRFVRRLASFARGQERHRVRRAERARARKAVKR